MIKFGIPSMAVVEDEFPGQMILTVHKNEGEKTKRKFSLSKSAAEAMGVVPGISKVAFSFDGGNYIAVIPDSVEVVAEKDKFLVNKELGFISKKAHEYVCTTYNFSDSTDTHLTITGVETNGDIKVATFTTTPITPTTTVESTSVNQLTENDAL